MFNIERDLAEEVLQQYNYDIEAAANFFLGGQSNGTSFFNNNSLNDNF